MARARQDLTGQQFGRLTVLRLARIGADYKAKWLCQCDCGTQLEVFGANLVRGTSRSCGCLRRDQSPRQVATPWRKPVGSYDAAGKRRIISGLQALREARGLGWAKAVMAAQGKRSAVPIDTVLGLGNGTIAPRLDAAQWQALDRALHKLMMTEGGNIVERKD